MVTGCLKDGLRSLAVEMPVQGVQIVLVPGKGRGLVATKEFKIGDVLIEEAPYSAVASLQEIDSACSGEFTQLKDAGAANRCSGCKCVRCDLLSPAHSLPNCLVNLRCSCRLFRMYFVLILMSFVIMPRALQPREQRSLCH